MFEQAMFNPHGNGRPFTYFAAVLELLCRPFDPVGLFHHNRKDPVKGLSALSLAIPTIMEPFTVVVCTNRKVMDRPVLRSPTAG